MRGRFNQPIESASKKSGIFARIFYKDKAYIPDKGIKF
jgi:hypothetical protein